MKRPSALWLVLLACLIAAPAAHADAFHTIFRDYKTSGKIDGCKYSAADLAKAKRQVPNDIEQYAPDFPDALDAALAQRRSGVCGQNASAGETTAAGATTTTPGASSGSPGGTAAPGSTTASPGTQPAATTPAGQTPQPTPTPTPAPALGDKAVNAAAQTDDSDAGAPAPLVALAILGVLMLLGALAYGLARWWAFEPRWLVRARHASAEAGWRASNSWAEFVDWVRLGR